MTREEREDLVQAIADRVVELLAPRLGGRRAPRERGKPLEDAARLRALGGRRPGT